MKHLEEFVSAHAAYGKIEVGRKFWETKDLDLRDVAALVRKNIKESVKHKTLPSGKYRVTMRRHRHAYNSSGVISVEISTKTKRDPCGIRLQIQHILDSYNYDASHAMYDYAFVRFYDEITINGR